MVEYQVGCSDISQSKAANVKVMAKSKRPGGDHQRARTVKAGSAVSS